MTTASVAPLSQSRLAPTRAMQLLGSAVLLGLLADLLFNGAQLGLNVPLWNGALIATLLFHVRRSDEPIGTLPSALLAASLGLSALVAWRSAEALQAMLLIASISLLLLALVAHDAPRRRRISITLLFGSLILAAFSTFRGVLLLPSAIPWREWLDQGARKQARSVGRAMLIALPLLLTFGALFFAADAVFETWVRDALTLNLAPLPGHIAWSVGGAAAATGVFWCGVTPQQPAWDGPRLTDDRRLDTSETGLVLGSLAALFAVFVAIQLQYLFSGQEHVQTSTGLTYADYARRGFFELVAVAALLLPVLLATDWARARNWRSLTTFRILGGLLVLLLLLVIASAFQRLNIYMDVYGLTPLRLYVAAFLAWLAVVFVWLLWTLLGQRRDQFIVGATLTGLVAFVLLVAVNPHATVAATNLARAEQGHEFDTPHALGLSADATPTLVTGLEVLPPDDACQLASTLLDRWADPDLDLELRSWNWSRQTAQNSVDSNRDELQSVCG